MKIFGSTSSSTSFSVEDTAGILGLSPQVIWRRIRNKDFPSIPGVRPLRISRLVVIEMMRYGTSFTIEEVDNLIERRRPKQSRWNPNPGKKETPPPPATSEETKDSRPPMPGEQAPSKT